MMGKNVIWVFLKIKPSTTTSIKRSRQELSIDMVIDRGIFKNNQMTLFSLFFITKTDMGVPNQGFVLQRGLVKIAIRTYVLTCFFSAK